MRKVLTYLSVCSLLVFFTNLLIAQQLELLPNDTIYKAATVADKFDRVDFTGYVYNNQGSNITINWELVYVDVPASWVYYYCDKTDCLDLQDFPSGSYTLNAGDTAIGKPQIGNDNLTTPWWAAGYGEVHIKVYAAADSANTSITGVYRTDVTVDSTNYVPVGISEIDLVNINVYPNPAIDQLRFNLPADLQDGSIQVYNILGDVVLNETTERIRNTALDVNDLQQGIYFAKILDESGMVLKTIKFSKK